jgi:hypothetical protein
MRRRNDEPTMAVTSDQLASDSAVDTAVYGQYAAASAGRTPSSSWVKYFPRYEMKRGPLVGPFFMS